MELLATPSGSHVQVQAELRMLSTHVVWATYYCGLVRKIMVRKMMWLPPTRTRTAEPYVRSGRWWAGGLL